MHWASAVPQTEWGLSAGDAEFRWPAFTAFQLLPGPERWEEHRKWFPRSWELRAQKLKGEIREVCRQLKQNCL